MLDHDEQCWKSVLNTVKIDPTLPNIEHSVQRSTTILDYVGQCWMSVLNTVKIDPTLPNNVVKRSTTMLHPPILDDVGATCWLRLNRPLNKDLFIYLFILFREINLHG